MNVWMYCIVDEQGSCKKLGLLREAMIAYVRSSDMNMIGISSVNRFHIATFLSMIEYAVIKKVDTIVVHDASDLSDKNKKYIMDMIQKVGLQMQSFYDVYIDEKITDNQKGAL